MKLNSKQRAILKKEAHNLDPIIRVGKGGITDNTIDSIEDAIKSRELIKLKILQNCEVEKEVIYETLKKYEQFQIVDMIGRTIIIFKENKEKPKVSTLIKNK